MPLIEVLPNTTNASAPGWAYVPDTGYDPSKIAIQPSGARQRATRGATLGGDGPEMSVKQNNAIIKHLAELDKDNHRDVHIPIPVRQKDGAGRISRGKVTPGVRKILQSQKTFANHLADEEAQIALQGQTPTSQLSQTPHQTAKAGAKPSTQRGRRLKSIGSERSSVQPARTPSVDAGASAKSPPGAVTSVTPFASSVEADDPLLKSSTPSRPSDALLEDLLATPPLSYTAARSKPSSMGLPRRRFCEICGYWGRVRCIKCGARVCGLECQGAHDDQRCLKFYA
ncbi:MAG: hypothetical protein M1816_007786 [Peltula sp. TS41687]|nr:MAG: hypothetical protein M1816_007786 [Peltula sp. TS41687]